MAVAATQQIINDGNRNLNLKYTLAGTSGDISNSILVNVSGFTDKDGTAIGANGLTLVGIDASLTGFSANLLWDATSNVELLEIPSDQPFSRDFKNVGGIKDNSGGGSTGDVLITTTGYTASGDGGHIYLKFKKT